MLSSPLPEGFRLVDGLVSEPEEQELLRAIEALPFEAVVMRGVAARRTVVHFGLRYGFDSARVAQTKEIPSFLLPLRARCAALVAEDPASFVEALVTRYPPGATIGWHRDAPAFGPVVLGVSLLSPCRMRFRRDAEAGLERAAVELAPRSAYVISSVARTEWQHSIPAVERLRYSVTFRTRRGAGGRAASGVLADRGPTHIS